MASDEKDGLKQGKTVSLDEKERLLAELEDFLDQLALGEESVGRDPDWSFSNFSFGLGIDPNG